MAKIRRRHSETNVSPGKISGIILTKSDIGKVTQSSTMQREMLTTEATFNQANF
jgi:hypothetical protein